MVDGVERMPHGGSGRARPLIVALVGAAILIIIVGVTSLLWARSPVQGCRLNAGVSQRGIPPAEQIYVGATGRSLAAVDELQERAGARLAIRRTYWGPGDTQAAVAAARSDLAAARIPWLSFKLPYSWDQMATGAGDDWAAGLADNLAALPGPVWVALHHEPEGDGPIEQWVATQQRLGPVMHARDNVAFTIIVTGWNQFYSGNPAYSLDSLWPGDGFVDVVGFDPYNFAGAVQESTGQELSDYTARIDQWTQQHRGLRWAIAETGYTNTAAQSDPGWLPRGVDSVRTAGGVALVYFDLDNPVDPLRSWALSTPEKQSAFSSALARSSYAMDEGCS